MVPLSRRRARDENGARVWFELITPDVDAAAAFYSEVFGWKAEAMPMEEMTYTVFSLGDDQVAGAMLPPMDEMPPNWGIYIQVDDADDVAAKATAAGATAMSERIDGPSGRFGTFADPVGAMFSIMQPGEEG